MCWKYEVNCLAKELEMDLGFVKVLLEKEMGWLGGTGEDLLDRDLMMEKSFEELVWWSALERVASHRWRVYLEEAEEIWELRIGIWGLAESICRRASRSFMSAATSGGVCGMKFLRSPAGMECLEAVRIVLRKESSPVSQEMGLGSEEKSSSDSVVKESHSAFLKLK